MSSTRAQTLKSFRLLVVSSSGGEVGKAFPIGEEPLTIGRERGCSIVLQEPSVSRRHAQVTSIVEGLKIVDLASGNGVWVGEHRVKEAVIEPGQRFRVGSTVFECQVEGADGAAKKPASLVKTALVASPNPPVSEARPLESRRQPAEVGRRREHGFLVRILSVGGESLGGQEVRVSGRSATIGRHASCTVTIPSKDVSRQHAELRLTDEGFRVVDSGSTNGVWVDDRKIEESMLRPGQEFRVGNTAVLVCELLDEPSKRDDEEAEPGSAAPIRPTARPEVPPPSRFAGRAPRDGDTSGPPSDVGPPEAASPSSMRPEKGSEGSGGAVKDSGATRIVARSEIHDVQQGATPDQAGPPESTGSPPSSEGREAPATRVVSRSELPGPPEEVETGADEPRPAGSGAEVLGSTRIASPSELGLPRPKAGTAEPSKPPPEKTIHIERPKWLARDKETRKPVGKEPVPKGPGKRSAKRPAGREEPPLPANLTRLVEASDAARLSEDQAAARTVAEEALRTVDFSRSVVVPGGLRSGTDGAGIESAGEALDIGAHQPFLLDDTNCIWYVVEGGVDVFTVALEKHQPKGTRSHFLGVLSGQCFFGFDTVGATSGFLAVAKQGTKLRKIQIDEIRQLTRRPEEQKSVAELIDTWIKGLSRALVRDLPARREQEVLFRARETVELDAGSKASAEKDVLWVPISSGEILFNDIGDPVFAQKQILFPVTPDSWIESLSDEFGKFKCTPLPTTAVINRMGFWTSLATFHDEVRTLEFINKRSADADEWGRLRAKQDELARAEREGKARIAGVMEHGATPKGFLATGATEPVLKACRLVGESLGVEIRRHPSIDDRLTYEEKVGAIASASSLRTRVVALRDDWWTSDHGAMLAQDEATKAPLALIPTSSSSYDIVDPKTGERTPVDESTSERLSSFAYTFYRPFPDGELGVMDVVRFGARGLAGEFRLLVAMGIVVGLFGTVTPYLTGRIYDAAIPQSDRGMLVGFGLALFGAALASSAFKFVQGIATVRVQGKMEYTIQAALWDRLLNLPANFFRRYSAGDLTERVNGIDRIQQLVSGAGVAAILGSFSGLFYVFQMFTYNMILAVLAVGLTLTFVGVTSFANYLQLRHQRVEIKLRGRISGLVLNLITGVSKLRVSGAENHAFRVWANEFSAQRKIGFTVGTIQNAVTVFSKIFPVISSMAIFAVMIYEQQKAAESGQPSLTTGDFIAFNAAYGLFLAAMQALADASLNMLRVVPVYERLKPIITTPAEVDSTKVFPGKIKGEIRLSHVHFRYSEDGPWIVKDLSLDINPGEMVAFVGGSGCGKSTLMRLMLGFEQPAMGAIYYDGQDLSSLDARMVRQQLGVVMQQSKVMPTEIYRNIIGVSSRTIEEAWDAAEQAGLAEDIRAMPMGMHTYVSEGGGTLSGGQRQRLMIARAVVNKPKVIFLDEATSALDNQAQSIVTESMDRMNATRIVIAHRLSTVANADKICYLEGGRIIEMGTYQELMEKDGLFAQLARRQMA